MPSRHRLNRRASSITRQARFRTHRLERLESRMVLATSPLQNPTLPLDVDNDGFILPLDALLIINWINTRGNDAPLPSTAPPYFDVDGDGHIVPKDVNDILTALNLDKVGPDVVVGLKNDTAAGGLTNNDQVTFDPDLVGIVTDLNVIQAARVVSLNGKATNFNLIPHLGAGGTFELNSALLTGINQGALLDGLMSIQVQATDIFGHSNSVAFHFTLDRLAQQPSLPDLLDASDSGQSNSDNITNVTNPQLSISSEAGTLEVFVGSTLALTLAGGPGVLFALPLADGTHAVSAKFTDLAGNVSVVSPTLPITVKSTAPQLAVSILPAIDDLTPRVRVKQPGVAEIPDGALVTVDVDLNFDGDYDDPDELDFGSSTFYLGEADFTLTRSLAYSDPEVGTYVISLRARASDIAGNLGISPHVSTAVDTLTNDVLREYVYRDDGAYTWTLNSTINRGTYTAYIIDMTSQTWRSPGEVNRTTWQHWLTIIVPSSQFGPLRNTGGLIITGSNNSSQPPSVFDVETDLAAQLAVASRSVIAVLLNTPNQPLFFPDEFPPNGRTEDALIAYTYDKFLVTGDSDWPLLLPMVKGAVKAMDTVQAFIPTVREGASVDDFMVTGASKRGWTTWLTAAVDDRVSSIIPMVFDALNLDEQMVHHYGAYGFFSEAIADYNEMQIFDRILTLQGRELGRIVDPYVYMADGRFNIPKLSINSTGDEFFVSDSSQFYIHDLPGPTYLRYIPNTGHGLGLDEGNMAAPQSIATFYWSQLVGETLPTYSWEVQPDQSIRVQTSTTGLIAVRLWQATNPVNRDFRDLATHLTWTSTVLAPQSPGVYTGSVPMPLMGATAFMIELEYSSTFPTLLGLPFLSRHVFTTDVVVRTNRAEVPWPFPIAVLPTPFAAEQSLLGLTSLPPSSPETLRSSAGLPTQVGPTVEPLEFAPLAESSWVAPKPAGPLSESLEESVDELLGSAESLEDLLVTAGL